MAIPPGRFSGKLLTASIALRRTQSDCLLTINHGCGGAEGAAQKADSVEFS
jgi:hypothetical protein